MLIAGHDVLTLREKRERQAGEKREMKWGKRIIRMIWLMEREDTETRVRRLY